MPKVTRMECVKPDWIRVVNAARRTWGKEPIDHEPSDKFKRQILLAEHSPIRLLEYDFTIADVRQWVSVHICRHHIGCEKFVHSQRQDINSDIEVITKSLIDLLKTEGLLREGWRERDYMFQGEPNEVPLYVPLCHKQAEKDSSYSCPPNQYTRPCQTGETYPPRYG